MARRGHREAVPIEVRDDDQVEPANDAIEEQPRRLHGSFRLGADPVFPESRSTFNLRPSIDELPEEQPLTVEINGRPVATLLCSPTGARELVLGWAFAQGYFDDLAQVQRLTPYNDRIVLMVDRPGCGGASWREVLTSGFDASTVRTPRSAIGSDPSESGDGDADDNGPRFDRTRFLATMERVFARFRTECGADGVHHAAVTDGEHLCAVSRDVCRHNAVDKVVGWTLTQRLDRTRLILCLSGRVSADLAYKASRAGVPIVVSRSLPTCEAVELAHAARITLVGRVLEPQRAIYAHPWRLTTGDEES
ncbi:MAG: FdhD protein [Thermomicrobiales bacterium]|nr:FdhD protein [Thermomicrobiales bacterium]